MPAAVLLGLLLGAQALATEPGQSLSPLDRLKQRSAAARWEQVRSQWTPAEEEETRETSAPAAADDPFAAFPAETLPARESETAAAPAPPPAMMNSGAGLGPEARRGQGTGPSAPSAPEPDDWFFGPDDPLAEQRGRNTAPPDVSGRQPDPERALTLPEFLQLHQDAFDAAFGRARFVAYQGEPPAPLSVLRAPPDYVGLRPITSIQPFRDYDPKGGDPCEHLCPLPGKCPPNKDYLCPEEYALAGSGSTDRVFAPLDYYWLPSNTYHNPLYFEDPTLERYGHVHFHDCVEPLFSMARFGAQVVGLPYQMALDPVCRRQYALGWYRPGDFAPKKIYQVPLNGRAAATAAGVYAGLFWLVP